jgi:GT2 family glycosyltransferase
MKDISIVILSYNTRDTTIRCIETLEKSLLQSKNVKSEIIIVDNSSSDGSVMAINQIKNKGHIPKSFFPLNKNIGFTGGNNFGASKASGEFILFLNSDVFIEDVSWKKLILFLKSDDTIAALTVRVNLPNGSLDKASHRGVPTLWNSFCYFAKLEQITKDIPRVNKLFGGYHLAHLDLSTRHQVASVSGAFLLTRRKVFEDISGFDEEFFMYGEDLDLAYRIRESGYKIFYCPEYSVTHLKYQSGKRGTKEGQKIARYHFFKSMKIFYNKHFLSKYSSIVSYFVNLIFNYLIKIQK